MSAWDFGPGDKSSSSLTWDEIVYGVTSTVKAATQSVGALKSALDSSTVTTNSRTDGAVAPTQDYTLYFVIGVGLLLAYKAGKL